ncbi:unnamed protein product [Sphagnum jensenii]
MESINLKPIGSIQTCFQEKFGVPRQSLQLPSAVGVIKLNPDPQYRDALRHLEGFSHLWIVFLFHEHLEQTWRPLITPPRVDAPGKIGVFASRSPHRPNPIGLSAVKLEKIDFDAIGGIEIEVSGVDLLNGTPILDIKPYLPYVDQIPSAKGGWTETEIPKFAVQFTTVAREQIQSAAIRHQAIAQGKLNALITEMLELDPRPTSQKKAFPISDPTSEGLTFAFRILDLDVKWRIKNGAIEVEELKTV